MKKHNYNISSVPKDGYLIFPLSMSRLSNSLSGREIYSFLKYFESKIKHISIDCVFLYTNDLYLNSDDKAVDVRKKSLNQMLGHKNEFMNILLKDRKYVPQAFHFLPWDYGILNARGFQEAKAVLDGASKNNKGFQESLTLDLKNQGREHTETNIGFLIEEIVVSLLLTQKEIPLPHTLTPENGWRLICYPGDPINSLIYTYKNHLLSHPSPKNDLFARSFYNIDKKVLIDFDIA